MNRYVGISISALAFAATVLLLAFLSSRSREVRSHVACTQVKVEILDSAKLGFVTEADIREILGREYGVITGQRIDSVNLSRIEKILDGRSAVLKSEAYVTGDGLLHIAITQREPIVMFDNGIVTFYADETGYVFPPVEGYDAAIPVVKGSIPLEIPKGYKGEPGTPRERQWLSGITELMKYLQSDKTWKDAIKSITVDAKGDLILYPVKGKERFLFGRPEDVRDKFRRLEDYYRYIVPSQEEGYYTIVNVKYDGQIVCRRK